MSQRATGLPLRAVRAGLRAAVVLLVAFVFASCSDDEPDSTNLGGLAPTTTAPTEETVVTGSAETSQFVALSDGQVEVWSSPDDADATSQMLSASSQLNGQLVFLVINRHGEEWLEVQLPTPPLGSTGFVRTEDIELTRHRFRIEVARGAHMMKVLVGNSEIISGPVAIGPDAPAPGTRTYVKDLLIPSTDGGPYGGHVYGLAGWSVTEAQLNSGPGVVAIHVAEPDELGQDVSTGAIGADQSTITRLVDTIGLPLGTPVLVTD